MNLQIKLSFAYLKKPNYHFFVTLALINQV
jgi:hypothetical protein